MFTTLILFTIFTIVNIIATFLIVRLFISTSSKTNLLTMGQINQYIQSLIVAEAKKIHLRIDQIFVVDKPSENEATKETSMPNDLSENDMISVPKDLKFEIEGGDTQVPPGYTEEAAK